MTFDKIVNLCFGCLGAILGTFIGGLTGLLTALIWLMVADYITGVLSAIKRKEVNSNVGFWGIVKKCLILLMVGVGNILDVYIITQGSTVRTAVIMFYAANDGISILENLTELGLPVPDKVRKILEQLKEGEDEQ